MKKYIHYIVIVLGILISTISAIYATINYSEYFPNWLVILQSQSDGWTTPISNNTKEIDTPEWCRSITSTQGTTMLIPTRTLAEWVSFRDHIPSGVSVNMCVLPSMNWVCSTTPNICNVWSPSGYSAWSCGWSQTWTCNGSNGWSNGSCSVANGACSTWVPYLGVLCDGDYSIPAATCPSSNPIWASCPTSWVTCSVYIGDYWACWPWVPMYWTAYCQ